MKLLDKESLSKSWICQGGRLGFTLIELLVIFGMITLTIFGYRLAGLLGGFIGFLVIPVTAAIWFLFAALVKKGIPMLPSCRNGLCCGYRDYEIKRFGEEFDWVCKCGDRYTRCGRRFMQVTDKGEKIPHKVWRSFRGWFPDEEKPEEN